MGNKTTKSIKSIEKKEIEEVKEENIKEVEKRRDTLIFENISISMNDLVTLLKNNLEYVVSSYITKEEFYNIIENYITYKDTSSFVKKGDLLLKNSGSLKEEYVRVEDFKKFKEKLKSEISLKLESKINKKIGEQLKDITSTYNSGLELINKVKEEYVSKEELKENLNSLCEEFSKEIESVKCEIGDSIDVINKIIEDLNFKVVEMSYTNENIKENKKSIEDNNKDLTSVVEEIREELNKYKDKVDYLENKSIRDEENISKLEGNMNEMKSRMSEMESNMEKLKGILNNILSKK